MDASINWGHVGIIPACAGSTGHNAGYALRSRDHPRMCGEHTCCVTAKSWAMGSSPHVRGALVTMPGMRSGRGIIPACAGSTRILLHKDDPVWDHPRMCGEHARHG